MDADKTTRTSSNAHPITEGPHLKRVSMLINSKKYPGQTFIGYALLHEFNPKRLSFFTSQKFPVDDELEVSVDFFGTQAKMKVLMANIHEQISSGRVMNGIPSEANPFPVRKFYRCYATILALEGLLPGMVAPEAPAVSEAPGMSLVSESGVPSDSDQMKAKLAALDAVAAGEPEKQAA